MSRSRWCKQTDCRHPTLNFFTQVNCSGVYILLLLFINKDNAWTRFHTLVTLQDCLHSVQWEKLVVREGSEFYRSHADPSVKHLFWLKDIHQLHHLYNCVKHYYPGQIAGTNLRTPQGWIAWLARAHVYIHNLLRVIILFNPKARTGFEPRSTGPTSNRCK